MYVNNISERSSSRVLQRPGGNQSINIFGGADEPTDPQPQRNTGRGRRQQQEITASIGSQASRDQQSKPVYNPNQSSNTFNDAAPAPVSANTPQQTLAQVNAPFAQDNAREVVGASPVAAAQRVNNIWGSDEQPQRSSTRVLRGPGGGSSGVAGALSGGPDPEVEQRSGTRGGYRANQTSANSPFSSEPEPQRSSTRVQQAPGGGSSGNILSWGH